MTQSGLSLLLDAAIAATAPLLIGALGELINERAGVLNLGLEGIMLVGALVGFVSTAVTANPYVGLVAGTAAGIAFASIHAVLTVSLKADQVISGIMLSLLGIGLTDFFGNPWTAVSISGFQDVSLPFVGPLLVRIPVIGEPLFHSTVPEYLSFALVPIVWYFLYHTNYGLEIIAVGDDPGTADTMGVSVTKTRYLAVLLGGAFAGAAGATLSLAVLKLWVTGIVAGRGWIIVGLVIFAQWRPLYVLGGAYLFGIVSVLQLRSQAIDVPSLTPFGINLDPLFSTLTSPSILSTTPYIATIIVLVIVSRAMKQGQFGAPGAFLKNYIREEE